MARARAIKEVFDEAKDEALVTKEEMRAIVVQASQMVAKAIKPFKLGEQYHQTVLDSCRDAFW